jgi:hypothetical protein
MRDVQTFLTPEGSQPVAPEDPHATTTPEGSQRVFRVRDCSGKPGAPSSALDMESPQEPKALLITYPASSKKGKAVKTFLWGGSALLLIACSKPAAKNVEARAVFTIPRIAQAIDSLPTDSLVHSDHLDVANVNYWGKFRFSNSIDLQSHSDSFPRLDHIESGPWLGSRDSISTDGLQLVMDYSTTISLKDHPSRIGAKYPVFLVNETTKPKVLWGKESRVYAIQEAVDSSGRWRPIEGKPYNGDGYGQWGEVIRPGQFVAFGMTKYAGDYKTRIRVRLVNDEAIYVSQPVRGAINYAQFRMKPDTYFFKLMQKEPIKTIVTSFYGALPLEYKPRHFE